MLRLKELRTRKKMTQSEAAAKIGVSQSTYSSWENERTQMDYVALISAARLFNVSVDYLLGKPHNEYERNNRAESVPVYGDLGLDKKRLVMERIGFEPVMKKLLESGFCFGLRVADDSMMPNIVKGDILIVRRQRKYKNGDMVVLRIDDSYVTVKNVIKTKKGIVLTESRHDSVPEFYSREDIIAKNIRVMGRVVELRRKI